MRRGVLEHTESQYDSGNAGKGPDRMGEIQISHSNLVCYYSLGMRAGMKTAIHHSGNAVK